MRYPNVTYHLLCFTYLPLNYDTLNDNCYISNGRRFTESALRILLLSLSVFLAPTVLLPLVSRYIKEAQLTQRDRDHTVS